jgi:integrase
MTRIKRLTQRACESAMPIEVVVPASREVVEAEMVKALRSKPDRVSRLRGMARLGAVADRLQDAPPGYIVKHRTRWLADGAGLWLVVSPGKGKDRESVARSWVYRWNTGNTIISKSGKARREQKRIGLGSIQTVSVERARELAEQCRRHLQEGRDPLLQKRARRAAVKIEERGLRPLKSAVDEYARLHGSAWSVRHAQIWRRSFQHLQPIMDLPVSKIDRAMIVEALRALWEQHPDTGQRLRGRLEQVLAATTAWGWRTGDNPAVWKGGLEFSFRPASQLRLVKNFAALSYHEMPDFMAKVVATDGLPARALELLIRTATRWNEVRGAVGDEFDLDSNAPTWTIPVERIKTRKHNGNKPFVIPLSPAAVASLRRCDVKPGQKLFPVHAYTALRLAKKISGQDITAHGFRACFKTYSHERTDFPREIVEACLNHKVAGDVESRYIRTTFIDKRRALISLYSDFCDGKTKTGDNVVAMRSGKSS